MDKAGEVSEGAVTCSASHFGFIRVAVSQFSSLDVAASPRPIAYHAMCDWIETMLANCPTSLPMVAAGAVA